uniref:Retroviral polymerase SH3-like domain-containing protein n=1 Tax=Tanacetum cinerariifolium TaxID=118510 RepID=A0A6L2KVI1_TANCI|nr:hypothetical protein [Tanacetum cinerariifolium]
MSSMGELTFFLGLHVKQKDDGIFICQDKSVAKILRKFCLTDGKLASTLIDTEKPLLKDPDGKDVDVHIYRYLKSKPHLGLWYPKDSSFNLLAYSDSDYDGASLDRKSTTGGCQLLGCRLISCQCKKQTVVATSLTEAKYVAAVIKYYGFKISCWTIRNQPNHNAGIQENLDADPLGKFDGKADEGFLVGYSVTSKAFRVFNSRTRIIQETLHISFLENQPNVAGSGPKWLFDIDTLTQSMNYQQVVAGNQPNHNAGIQENLDAGKVIKEVVSTQQYVLLPLWSTGSQNPHNTDADPAFDVKENKNEVHVSPSSSDKPKKHDGKAKREAKGKSHVDLSIGGRDLRDEFKEFSINSTYRVNAACAPVTDVGPNSTNNTNSFNDASPFDNAVRPNFEIGRQSSFWILLNILMIQTCLHWKTLFIQMMKKMLV